MFGEMYFYVVMTILYALLFSFYGLKIYSYPKLYYLEEMNQHMKLQRYLRLRMVFLLSVLFAIVWAVFGIVR